MHVRPLACVGMGSIRHNCACTLTVAEVLSISPPCVLRTSVSFGGGCRSHLVDPTLVFPSPLAAGCEQILPSASRKVGYRLRSSWVVLPVMHGLAGWLPTHAQCPLRLNSQCHASRLPPPTRYKARPKCELLLMQGCAESTVTPEIQYWRESPDVSSTEASYSADSKHWYTLALAQFVMAWRPLFSSVTLTLRIPLVVFLPSPGSVFYKHLANGASISATSSDRAGMGRTFLSFSASRHDNPPIQTPLVVGWVD